MVVNEHQISLSFIVLRGWSFSVTWISESYKSKRFANRFSVHCIRMCESEKERKKEMLPSSFNYVLICFVFSWSIIVVIWGYKSNCCYCFVNCAFRNWRKKTALNMKHLTSATAISKIFSNFQRWKWSTFSHFESILFSVHFTSNKFQPKNCHRLSASEYMLNAFDKRPFTGTNSN